jgi:hypothetical protein
MPLTELSLNTLYTGTLKPANGNRFDEQENRAADIRQNRSFPKIRVFRSCRQHHHVF